MSLFLTTLFLHAIFLKTTEALQASGREFHDPYFKGGRTVIVQLFEWKFIDIEKECKEFLGPGGFGGVQISPVAENAIRRDFDRPWWERYNPISYQLITRSGNRDQLKHMIRTCNDEGVRVYVDVVMNHMAAPIPFGNYNHKEQNEVENLNTIDELLEGTGGSRANASARDYPGVPYTSANFHTQCAIQDWSDGQEIRNCEFLRLPDLDHFQDIVVDKVVNFLNDLISMGVAGFRIDTAKYIWPVDIKVFKNDSFKSDSYQNSRLFKITPLIGKPNSSNIYSYVYEFFFKKTLEKLNNLNSKFDFPKGARPFCLLEIIDSSFEAVSKTEYSGYGTVTESQHAIKIADIFNGKKPLSVLLNWGPAMGFLLPPDGLVFVDTHYTQRGVGLGGNVDHASILSFERPKKYIMAVTFMLAHPYGIKRIMSSYRFKNRDQGPPTDEQEEIISPTFNDEDRQCITNSGWVCEHRWNAIANMVAFSNIVKEEGINSFYSFGPNHITFCRGTKGFLAINNDLELDFDRRVYACVEAGEYCDAISGRVVGGNCTGRMVTVDAEGMARVLLPVDDEYRVLAIHLENKLE